MKQFYAVCGVVLAFLVIGFTYKYTFSPEAASRQNAQQSAGLGVEGKNGLAPIAVEEIGRRADDIPPPITRKHSETVTVDLVAEQLLGQLADGVTYEYWTYNSQVPGPMIRVREGDTVQVRLSHLMTGDHHHGSIPAPLDFSISGGFIPLAYAEEGHVHDDGHAHEDAHSPEATPSDPSTNHELHSIDLHAVLGPGGGAMLSQTGHDEVKTFAFKAMRPGIYIYHCASPHVPTHITNGMYGMILVEPKEGLSKVDREFYVMQGEMYTKGKFGEKGKQDYSYEKLLAEKPEYFVMNGRVGSLTGDRALKAKVGETVRIYYGVGTFVASNFHLIGGIFDKLYPEGDLLSPPHRNVQTTVVPAGGAAAVEFVAEVPGKFLLVDHALPRSIDKGALGELIVEGADRPEIIRVVE